MSSAKTALYRHFDSAGTLLYVGISISAANRLSQHMHGSPWAREIASMTIEHHDSRAAAEAAERVAIKAEKPLWNKAHNRPDRAMTQNKKSRALPRITDSEYAAQFHGAITNATGLLMRVKDAVDGFVVSEARFSKRHWHFEASFPAGAYKENELLGDFRDNIMFGKDGSNNIVCIGMSFDNRENNRLIEFNLECDTEENLIDALVSLAPETKEFADEHGPWLAQAIKKYGEALRELARTDFRQGGNSPAFTLPKRARRLDAFEQP
jgi:hypothetical protein